MKFRNALNFTPYTSGLSVCQLYMLICRVKDLKAIFSFHAIYHYMRENP